MCAYFGKDQDASLEESPVQFTIIGGGVAGCAAASWAARQGAEVLLINEGLPLGGHSIHVTALPSRVMMTAATEYYRAGHPRFPGVVTETKEIQWDKFTHFRRELVAEQSRAYFRRVVEDLPNVTLLEGRARFASPDCLEINGKTIEFERLLLTPGSHARPPAIKGINDAGVLALHEFLRQSKLPKSLFFLGSSPTSLAYAQALRRFGVEITLLLEEPWILSEILEKTTARTLEKLFVKEGISLYHDVKYKKISAEKGTIQLSFLTGTKAVNIEAETAVYVNHRVPSLEGLNLEKGGVERSEKGFIFVDETLQTSNQRVFAAGDAIGRGFHASASAYDAVLASRNAIVASKRAGHTTVIPFAIYTDPEFAGVGWNALQARQSGFEPQEVQVPFRELPAARALGYDVGFVQLCRDPHTDQLLGARILGPHASELIMEAAIAIRAGMTTAEISALIHPSISLGSALGVACALFQR